MKIDNVDDLLVDILGVPDHALKEAEGWLEITKLFVKAISSANDLLVIDTETTHYEGCQPYLQICYEDDGAMTIEAVSSKFLNPALPPDAQNTLSELGWQLSEEKGLPNYYQFLRKEDADPKVIAQLFAQTFRTVYGVTPSDTIEVRAGQGVWPSEKKRAEDE
jgi:hypothetical protein